MRQGNRSFPLPACLLAAAALLAGCVSTASTPTPLAAASPPATTVSVPTPSTAATLSPAAGSVVLPEDTSDPGDEPDVSETPAIGFTPGPTGAPPPTPSGAVMVRLPGEPDPALTPGSLNPAVTQADIGSTICASGWTATIRPPESYTNDLKKTQIGQYGYADKSAASYEEDHLISLELGGNPTDPKNLWPEPYTVSLSDGRSVGAHVKDAFESKLKKEVCAGTMTLAQAQTEVGDHWVHFDFQIP